MQKATKKILAIITLMVALAGGVLGAWMYYYVDTQEVTVTSEGGTFEQTQAFAPLSLNTTSTAQNDQWSSTIFHNGDGARTIFVNFTTTRTDLPDACTQYENDCSVYYKYMRTGTTLPENFNGTIDILAGEDVAFRSYMSCVKSSCPQIINTTVTVEGI